MDVYISTEFITLGQFLKFTGIIDSGSYAKMFLSENQIFVNGELESRRGRKLYPGYVVNVYNSEYFIKVEQ